MHIMRKLWLVLTYCIAAFYFISCFSWLIPPSFFSYTFLLALSFTYFLLAHLLMALLVLIFIQREKGLILLMLSLAGIPNIGNSFAFNIAAGKFNPAKDSSHLRLMNWNVAYWQSLSKEDNEDTRKREQMLGLFANYNPDVLCMHEYAQIRGEWHVNIQQKLDSMGFKYSLFPPSTPPLNNRSYDGTIIYSKIPIVGASRIETGLKIKPEPLLSIDVLLNNKPVRISTVHLLSYALFDGKTLNSSGEKIAKAAYKNKRSILQKLKYINLYHQQQVQLIKTQISKSPHPTVLCGDFNVTPAYNVLQQLKGDMQDAYLHQNFGIGKSFYSLSPFLRIDYCFVDKRLRIVQNKVDKQHISDHYPLVTDISW